MLGIVELVPQGREPAYGNEAQTCVSGVRRKLGQTDPLVDAVPHILLKGSRRHSVETHPYLIQDGGGKDMGLTQHQILGPTRDLGSIAWNRREKGAREGLEQVPVTKAIAQAEVRRLCQRVVQPEIEVVFPISKRGRGDEVLG